MGIYIRKDGTLLPAATVRGPEGFSNFLVYEDGVYPTRRSTEPHVFIGPTNPDDLSLMLIGDVWINNTENNPGPAYLRVNEIGSPGTPGGDALDAWFETKFYEDPADPGTYLIGG